MYLSLTCLTSSCSPFLKRSASSISMNLGLSNALYASIWLNRYPVLVDYYNYRTEMSSKGHLNRDCNKCNTRDSIYVYNTLEEKRSSLN